MEGSNRVQWKEQSRECFRMAVPQQDVPEGFPSSFSRLLSRPGSRRESMAARMFCRTESGTPGLFGRPDRAVDRWGPVRCRLPRALLDADDDDAFG
jgi:hypothetical protein